MSTDLLAVAGRRVVSSTREREDIIWRCHLEPAFGSVPLGKLRRSAIERWVSELEGRLAPATVVRCMAVLHKMLADAVREGLTDRNPANDADPPREHPAERRYLSRGAKPSRVGDA